MIRFLAHRRENLGRVRPVGEGAPDVCPPTGRVGTLRGVPISRARSPWSGRGQGLALVAAVAVAANVWGWWPAGASVWAVLAFAAGMCPQPEYFEIESKAEKTAMTLRHMRGALAGGGGVWRIGPPPEPDYPAFSPETLQAKEGPPATRWSPVSYAAVAATLAAAAAALIDYGVYYAMSHPSAPDVSVWRLDAPAWAYTATVPLSALFGWWAAQSVAAARRQVLCAPTMGVPPAARFVGGVRAFALDVAMPVNDNGRRRPSPAAVSSLLAAGAAAGALWWFPIVGEWVGLPVAFGLVAVAVVAAVVAGPMRASAAATVRLGSGPDVGDGMGDALDQRPSRPRRAAHASAA